MKSGILVSGTGKEALEDLVLRYLEETRLNAIGIASAYVSIYGIHFIRSVISKAGVTKVRLIADVGDAITHPMALRLALDAGWRVRVVAPAQGSFHPKMIVGGTAFTRDNLVSDAKFVVVGSANITKGGLRANIECSYVRISDQAITAASKAFRRLWQRGVDLDEHRLDDYEIEFAQRNRERSTRDLRTLGVSDEPLSDDVNPAALRQRSPPQSGQRTIATPAAASAWAGLESFTGEFRFQIEFPRDAGEVLGRILGRRYPGQVVDMRCEDGVVRQMRYRFYSDNSMFRLNVPNDTPGVDWARENRSGIAQVASVMHNDDLTFRILRPGKELSDVVGCSVALGTWGKTTTRLYGWS